MFSDEAVSLGRRLSEILLRALSRNPRKNRRYARPQPASRSPRFAAFYDALRECFPNDYIRGHTLAGAFVSEPKKPCGFAVE
jgi:hypothetical protein